MKNLFTYLKALWSRVSGLESRQVGVILEEAAIEHPFSTHSAPFGTCWQPSGKLHSVVRCAAMLVMLLTLGSGNAWGTPASVGTVMYSENWGGYADTNVPSGSVSSSTGNRVVYNSGSVTYTCSNGTGTKPGTTKVTTGDGGNLAGGSSPELMVGKKGSGSGATGGKIEISGIPSGEADSLTLTYKQNGNSLQVSITGTGYKIRNGSSDVTSVSNSSANTYTYAIVCGSGSTFTLTFQAGSTKNVRLDDISVSVRTAGSSGCINGTITYSKGSNTYTGGNTISGSHANDTKECGSNLTLPGATFTTTGYTQDGWATSDGGSKVYNLSATNYSTEGDATLYPHWSANNYTVTWMSNGSQHTTTSVSYGSKPTFPSAPSTCDATSTTFIGWTKTTWTGKQNQAYVDGLTTDATKVHTSNSTMSDITANGTVYHAVFAKAGAGGSGNIQLSYTSLGLTTSYESESTKSVSDVDFYCNDIMTGNSGSDGYQKIQFKKSSTGPGYIYNSEILPGNITSIVFGSTTRDMTVNFGTSSNPDGSTETKTCSSSSLTATPTGNYKYFKILNSEDNAAYTGTITINYSDVSYSDYLTTCCTELGSINGSVSWSNAATAVVSWDNIDHVSSWTVKYKTHAAGAYATWAGEQSTAAGRRSVTITGLTPCTDYDFQIIANPASGYCEKGQTIEDSQTHNWTVTSTGVTHATASPTIPSTTCSGFSTTISPATGYALPADITVTNATKSWNSSTGALSISSVTGNVSITITPTCVSPVITADPADASYYVGDAPTALSVTATLASGTLTYLWKVSTNGGSTWSDATGTNNTFSYSGASLSTASAGTLKFKCIVGNSEGGCSVESGVATITVSNASYFPNGKTIFIQAESTSAWSDANYDCVKAWFHTAGGSETAQTTYWLFNATGGDSGKKLFATVVPATGDLPYLDIQRFTHDCSLWRNKNGGCSYSDANGSNTIRSTGNTDTYDAKDDYIRWNVSGVTMNLMSSDAWLTPVASMTDQGSGIWSGSYEYTPSNTSTEYVIATNYNGNIGNAGSNSNATLSGMVVGSTYDVTATLDIKDHSLEMSKTFVKGTVHFNLQGHGLAISDLTNVTAGSKISAPSPAPTDAAYDFGGWYKEPACTNAWNFASDVVNETMTLYAKWTPHNFTITYEGLAGASNTNPTSYTIETATIVLANPGSRTGYTFTGWTLGGSPITQIVLGTTGDKTITATWSINTPNLAVSAADHVVITATPASESAIAEGANRNVNYNKTVTLNCTPDEHWNLVWDVYKTGESSTKVALSGSGDGATFTMPDYAVTVSAVMTEAAYKTVCFKNNGEDIDGYASVKVYVGESPVAPTLTDGTSGDACDPTSDKHYGWTKETWTSTIATQSEIDARTGTEAVYEKSAALPVVGAGDPATITYHAVWAAGSGSPVINSTLIAKWDKQALTASTAVKAKDKDGNMLNDVTMTSSHTLGTAGTYCYQNTITSTVTITISGLDFSAYDKGALSFYARGSQQKTIDVDYSTGGAYSDLVTTPNITKKEQAYEISNIPKATTSIKLTYVYGTSGETFYFGTVRAYGVNNTPSYEFTELTDDNTSGWTGSDWDGYYIITGNSSTKALRSSGICGFSDFATVSAVDSKITTSDVGLIFRVNYSSENSGYVVQGLGGGDYMATSAANSDAFTIMTTSVAYLYGMSYNSLAHTSSTYLKWSTNRFGIYISSTGVNPTLYKMLGAAENFLTTCCTQYDISGASTSGTAVTGGTLTSTDNSACEDREVKITANVSDGYRFDSWTITAGGSLVARKDGSAEIEDGNPIYVFDMPAADVTVSAAFTRVYPVTYDANGGTGEMIDVNSPYAAGDKVTVLANTFTKAGYNFDSWSYSPAVSVTDGKFDMPSSDVTITAQWTAKPLNNIILAQTEAEIYDQQYVQIDVTYDPADIVTKGYTLTGPALTKVVTTGSTQTQLKISATKAGVIISEVVSETVSIKANADETKTASVVVTIKPLPRVHFTDIIHNVVFGDVVEEIVGNVLSGAKTTPTHSDISDPGASYNTCERQHLHLLGWIESTWADAHPGATSGEITGAGSSIYYEAGASINVEVQNGKTFYAVWCIVE